MEPPISLGASEGPSYSLLAPIQTLREASWGEFQGVQGRAGGKARRLGRNKRAKGSPLAFFISPRSSWPLPWTPPPQLPKLICLRVSLMASCNSLWQFLMCSTWRTKAIRIILQEKEKRTTVSHLLLCTKWVGHLGPKPTNNGWDPRSSDLARPSGPLASAQGPALKGPGSKNCIS